MPAVIHTLHRFVAEYGHCLLLALLVHALILTLLLTTKFSQPVSLPVTEPIISFLYQPPSPVVPAAKQVAADALPSETEITAPISTEQRPSLATASEPNVNSQSSASGPQTATEQANEKDAIPEEQAKIVQGESLAQRALNWVAKPTQAAIDQDAAASYQQLLQQQQQPRLTVDKKHWPISQDPKAQVVAPLDDGTQIVRTKGGCLIGDPSKDGFEALMAAKVVPCGDEVSTSELLKQALDKHIKR